MTDAERIQERRRRCAEYLRAKELAKQRKREFNRRADLAFAAMLLDAATALRIGDHPDPKRQMEIFERIMLGKEES